MTKQAEMKINTGVRVRSFDFPHDRTLEGETACYVEGVVEGIEFRDGCYRYKVRVEKHIFGGEPLENFDYVYPPVNGTPKLFGGNCDGVEIIK